MYFLPLLFYCMTYCNAANILYAMPYPAKSHSILLRPIGLELARRGHNVTTIALYEEINPPPNYHQVIVDMKKIWEDLGIDSVNIFDRTNLPTTAFLDLLWHIGLAFTEYILKSTNVQEFLRNDNKFDLVMSENFLIDATTVLAHKYNAPLVLISAIGNCMRHNIAVGNPLDLSNVPYEYTFLEDPGSFMGRLQNVYVTSYEYFWWRYWYLEEQMKLVKRYVPGLSESLPSLYEIHRNASLFLVNGHYSLHTPKNFLPNIIEIMGVHLVSSDSEVLSEDIEKVLNESKQGVIYINFGSVVQSVQLSVDKKNAILNNLKKLNHTVLWKWEETEMEGKPPNVVIRKWFPQKKILEHPNVKLFICHGGLLGIQEAIFHGVPLLSIPVFGDHYNNAYLTEQAGFGKILKYDDINEDTFNVALKELIFNSSYSDIAKRTSRRFKDRPISALNTAMFWIEYVLRNNGEVLREHSSDSIDWFMYELWVIMYFLSSAFFFILCVFKLFWMCSYVVKKYKTLQSSKHKQL